MSSPIKWLGGIILSAVIVAILPPLVFRYYYGFYKVVFESESPDRRVRLTFLKNSDPLGGVARVNATQNGQTAPIYSIHRDSGRAPEDFHVIWSADSGRAAILACDGGYSRNPGLYDVVLGKVVALTAAQLVTIIKDMFGRHLASEAEYAREDPFDWVCRPKGPPEATRENNLYVAHIISISPALNDQYPALKEALLKYGFQVTTESVSADAGMSVDSSSLVTLDGIQMDPPQLGFRFELSVFHNKAYWDTEFGLVLHRNKAEIERIAIEKGVGMLFQAWKKSAMNAGIKVGDTVPPEIPGRAPN